MDGTRIRRRGSLLWVVEVIEEITDQGIGGAEVRGDRGKLEEIVS